MLAPRHQVSRSELARKIDHTLLSPTATVTDVDRLCDEAVKYGFWSVCIGAAYVPRAVERLRGSGVKVCTVVGFPLGFTEGEVKLAAAKKAVEEGADEIDMVMNLGAFKSADYGLVSNEIRSVARYCDSAHKVLKVIIETCYLTDEEKVRAAQLAESAGADYVKTSTGFGTCGATAADVALLRRTLHGTKVKASGGIRTLDMALQMIEAGADRIGTSSSTKILDEWEGKSKNLKS
jgi:deoxyribose-phosphate aldolase